jgi:hypothetical protein
MERLLGTVCVSPHGHMHRVDEAGSCDTGSQPVASCDVKHPIGAETCKINE